MCPPEFRLIPKNVSPGFSKAKNRLYLDIDWKRPKKGEFFLVECYEATDPEIYGDVYNDIWIKKYSTALLKMQWGSNLKKYENTEIIWPEQIWKLRKVLM